MRKVATKRVYRAPARDWFNQAMAIDTDECLIWPFARSEDGYARLKVGKRFLVASRYACAQHFGFDPGAGYDAAHTCGNGGGGCINKRHLVWKTHKENINDKRYHGTLPSGERHHQSKLLETDVTRIRSLRGAVSRRNIAAQFGVGRSTIDNILDGVTWRHV